MWTLLSLQYIARRLTSSVIVIYYRIHHSISYNHAYVITGIWITQIDCTENSGIQAPGGCTQYHFGNDGVVKSFNFEGVQYLADQNYKMCIRSEPGACFIGFAADTNHFMLQVSIHFLIFSSIENTSNFILCIIQITCNYILKLHPTIDNNKFRPSSLKRTTGRPPSGHGEMDCTFDFLLIPNARGNLTKFGNLKNTKYNCK